MGRSRGEARGSPAPGPRRGALPHPRGAVEVGVRRLPRLHRLAARRDRGLADVGPRRHRRLLRHPGRDRGAGPDRPVRRGVPGAASHRDDPSRARPRGRVRARRGARSQRRPAAGLRARGDRCGPSGRRHRAGAARPRARSRGAHPAGRLRRDDRARGRRSVRRALPELRGRLQRGAVAFDTAAYSHRAATAKQADDLLRLAEYIAESAPDLSEDAPEQPARGEPAGADA